MNTENKKGEKMERKELHRQLDEVLNEFEQKRQFGYIQIDFQAGRPDLIRKMTTQKLISTEGNSRYEHPKR
jgi:sulfatase maturation enzyme AslB (radical SAM superfamily)